MVKTSDFESENSGSSPDEAANDIIWRVTLAIAEAVRSCGGDVTKEAGMAAIRTLRAEDRAALPDQTTTEVGT